MDLIGPYPAPAASWPLPSAGVSHEISTAPERPEVSLGDPGAICDVFLIHGRDEPSPDHVPEPVRALRGSGCCPSTAASPGDGTAYPVLAGLRWTTTASTATSIVAFRIPYCWMSRYWTLSWRLLAASVPPAANDGVSHTTSPASWAVTPRLRGRASMFPKTRGRSQHQRAAPRCVGPILRAILGRSPFPDLAVTGGQGPFDPNDPAESTPIFATGRGIGYDCRNAIRHGPGAVFTPGPRRYEECKWRPEPQSARFRHAA